jgi:hypothetical protein
MELWSVEIEPFLVSRSGFRVEILQTKFCSALPATRNPQHATKAVILLHRSITPNFLDPIVYALPALPSTFSFLYFTI